eukprot:403362791
MATKDKLLDSADYVPDAVRGQQACTGCGLILTSSQWKENGSCPNCKDEAHLETTNDFGGVVALMHPKESWVAKWNNFTKFVPGLYAIQFQEHNQYNPENEYEMNDDE